ncbi:Ku protein [Aquibaculum arenosum]|uniref:Non-homologous end joining protein Ku n=1 Tax=Aquibaculum arenosum TaxID=3032591 RepID=A0ABT5YK11_9PROT|nr:Ku protein [Fodinicurvata sp. CAU 1616]MDF2095286.1 Ku protein [Fodinicurvata sp. CAU 1616]
MASLGNAVWTGQIRLSLVSLPVKLYAATQSRAKLAFHQVHEPSRKRVRYEKVVPGIGPVDKDEILRGYEYEKGRYVLLSDEEVNDIKLDAKKTLELVQFVDHCEIDPIYFDRPYFVVPDGELAEDAFRVVRDALRRSRKVGLGQIVVRGREYIAALEPCGKGMLLETLRFDEELRRSDAYFESIADTKSDKDLVALAEELIERQAGPFEPESFTDRYSKALEQLVKAKIKGREAVSLESEETTSDQGGEVVDLMQALKKSLGDKKGGTTKRSSKSKASGRSKSTSSRKRSGKAA